MATFLDLLAKFFTLDEETAAALKRVRDLNEDLIQRYPDSADAILESERHYLEGKEGSIGGPTPKTQRLK